MGLISGLMTNQKELNDLDKMFKMLDTDNNGVLDREELQNGISDVLGPFGNQQVNWVEFFNSLDHDKSNSINFEEFIVCARDRAVLLNRENVDNVFKMFDKNGDGAIDMDELRTLFQNQVQHDHSQSEDNDEEKCWKEIMQQCDLDGNGEISREEFQQVMENLVKMTMDQK